MEMLAGQGSGRGMEAIVTDPIASQPSPAPASQESTPEAEPEGWGEA